MRKKIIFDLDDTLIPNQHDYDFAKIALYLFLEKEFAKFNLVEKNYNHARIGLFQKLEKTIGYRCPDLQSILNIESEAYKHNPDRSFVLTYKEIADTLKISVDSKLAEELQGITRLLPHETDQQMLFVKDLLEYEVGIDVQNVKKLGFKMERFPTSLKETYLGLCEKLNQTPDPAKADKAYRIGLSAFDFQRYKQKGLLPGVKNTLDYLLSTGDSLAILSKGDTRIQHLKIGANKLDRWFMNKDMHIVPNKSTEVLLEHCHGWNKDQVYHIGNSVRSDVNPALEAGIKMIYIPCETWQYEREHSGVPKNERLITLSEIGLIPKIYPNL